MHELTCGNHADLLLVASKEAVYIPMFIVLAIMLTTIAVVSWKDTTRGFADIFAPWKYFRLQFRLRTLLFITALVSIILKVVTAIGSNGTFADVVSLLATVGIAVSAVGFLLHFYFASYCATFQRRPKIDQRAQVPANDEDLQELTGKKGKKKVRFTQKKRQTSSFRW